VEGEEATEGGFEGGRFQGCLTVGHESGRVGGDLEEEAGSAGENM